MTGRFNHSNVVFSAKYAFVTTAHGSSKTKNIKDAIAHTKGGKPLARLAAYQMPAVREQCAAAHRLPIMRVLPRPPGADARRQVSRKKF